MLAIWATALQQILSKGEYKPFISSACFEVATGAAGAGRFVDLFFFSFLSFLSFSGGSFGAGRLG